MTSVNKIINTRKSIRKFKNKEVKEKVIHKIINAGLRAPSRGNSQPWKFVLVQGLRGKRELYNACYKQKLMTECAFAIVVLGVIDPRKDIPNRTKELVEHGAFGQDVKEFADHVLDDWKHNELKIDAALNASIAASYMTLSCEEYGVGCCWLKLVEDEKVLAVVNADPEQYYNAGVLCFGYPDEKPKLKPRKNMKEVLYHESL